MLSLFGVLFEERLVELLLTFEEFQLRLDLLKLAFSVGQIDLSLCVNFLAMAINLGLDPLGCLLYTSPSPRDS